MKLDTIYCGDNAKLLEAMPSDSIDLTVTSPPYDNLRTYNGFAWDFEAVARQLYRVTKPGGVVVWVVADATINGSETGTSFRQALHFMECGFNLHDTMIYWRDCPPMNDRRYQHEFEYMFVLTNGPIKTFNPIMESKTYTDNRSTKKYHRYASDEFRIGTRRDKELKIIGNIWRILGGGSKSTKDDFAFDHPAIFPEALARDHIISWSNPGDIVLDPFCGSGTTLKMAKVLQRHYIGIDISQEYVELSQKRVMFTPDPLPLLFDESKETIQQGELW